MPIEQIKVPRPGESITEATINRWISADGAYVKVDDPLYELGTDKATQEVAAPVAGVLKILVKEGETIPVETIVGQIDTDAKAPTTSEAKASSSVLPPAPTAPTRETIGIPSPAAARILAEANLTADQVKGTGPAGRITKEDALNAQSASTRNNTTYVEKVPPVIQSTAPIERVTRQAMTSIRRRIAARLLESQNSTATLTTFNEADMTAIQELRAKYNEKFEKKYGIKLGFMSVFVKASVEALKAFPLVNSRIDGNDLVLQHFYDIGVAVSTEKGLMVPIVRNADQLGFAEIEKEIGLAAKKAREGKITVADLEGGTFTITNGGTFGSMMSTPILNPPQAAILGMHSIQKRAVVINDQILIRPMMYLALSYDHRIIDGREAVQFLVRIKECIENPERMLLNV